VIEELAFRFVDLVARHFERYHLVRLYCKQQVLIVPIRCFFALLISRHEAMPRFLPFLNFGIVYLHVCLLLTLSDVLLLDRAQGVEQPALQRSCNITIRLPELCFAYAALALWQHANDPLVLCDHQRLRMSDIALLCCVFHCDVMCRLMDLMFVSG
jgi:hypothetical protein